MRIRERDKENMGIMRRRKKDNEAELVQGNEHKVSRSKTRREEHIPSDPEPVIMMTQQ